MQLGIVLYHVVCSHTDGGRGAQPAPRPLASHFPSRPFPPPPPPPHIQGGHHKQFPTAQGLFGW